MRSSAFMCARRQSGIDAAYKDTAAGTCSIKRLVVWVSVVRKRVIIKLYASSVFINSCISLCVTELHVAAAALQAAVELAEQISSFPQLCMRADRTSAIYSCYDAPSFTQVT